MTKALFPVLLRDLPGYVFRVFVTNRNDPALDIWRDYNGRASVECRIDELKNELAADHFCLRSYSATESAFLAVLFGFKLQRQGFTQRNDAKLD